MSMDPVEKGGIHEKSRLVHPSDDAEDLGLRLLQSFAARIQIHVFEGGKLPKRQTEQAIGYDAYVRAIVDSDSKPTIEQPLRRTRADFLKAHRDTVDDELQPWIKDDPNNPDKYIVALPPGERCMVGLGFAISMEFPLYFWVAPRSGFASRGVNLDNSPGTVDPDYRGEPGGLVVNHSGEPLEVSHHLRVAQLIFGFALMPNIELVERHEDLPSTNRGAGGFGSTGTHG
jgi:dUTP diphosphatase